MFNPSAEITGNNSPPQLQILNQIQQIVGDLSRMDLESKIAAILELIKTADFETLKGVLDQLPNFLYEFSSLTEVWHYDHTEKELKSMKSALHVAAAHREYEIVEYLVNSMGFAKALREDNIPWLKNGLVAGIIRNIHRIDDNGFENKLKILKLLFNIRPELIESEVKDTVHSLHSFTPLYIAAKRRFTNGKQIEFMKLLLHHKANPNAKTNDGKTLLIFLALLRPTPPNLMKMMKMLIENGANPDAKPQGISFVHVVAFRASPQIFDEVVQYLVSIGRTNSLLARAGPRPGYRPLDIALLRRRRLLQSTLQVFANLGVTTSRR